MAQNTTIEVNKDAWTQLTNANISSATWQVNGANAVLIIGTVGETSPAITSIDGIIYEVREGETTLRTLLDIFPGVAATRLFARSIGGGSKVFISHAS